MPVLEITHSYGLSQDRTSERLTLKKVFFIGMFEIVTVLLMSDIYFIPMHRSPDFIHYLRFHKASVETICGTYSILFACSGNKNLARFANPRSHVKK